MNIDLEQLRALMRSMKEFKIAELELQNGDDRILLRRGKQQAVAEPVVVAGAPAPAAAPAPSAPPSAAEPAAAAPAAPAEDPNVVSVTSPFVGTFYRAPSPDADPFVQEGDTVKPAQVLCIVEAMKLMNEIESEISGTIVEIIVENGKPVEYGDELFRVRKG